MKTSRSQSPQFVDNIREFAKALSEDIRIRIMLYLQDGALGLQHFVDIF